MEERPPEPGSSGVNEEGPHQAWFLYVRACLVELSVKPTPETKQTLRDLHGTSPDFVESVRAFVIAELEQELALERVTARPAHLRPETWREEDDPCPRLERRLGLLRALF